jgi:hypothetical protein
MSIIQPPPSGEVSLIRRGYKIGDSYGCSRSADAVYIALAEELTRIRPTVLLTFDQGIPSTTVVDVPILPTFADNDIFSRRLGGTFATATRATSGADPAEPQTTNATVNDGFRPHLSAQEAASTLEFLKTTPPRSLGRPLF